MDSQVEPLLGAFAPAEALIPLAEAVIVTDLSGRVMCWSAAAQRLLGWSESQARGRLVAELTGFGWWPAQQADRAATLRAGRVWSGELPARHRDGNRIAASVLQAGLFSMSGELCGVVSVVPGPTADAGCGQHRADEPFRTIVETAGVGLGLVDSDGIFCYVNPWLAELIGRPARTLVGLSVLDLLDPAGQRAVRAAMARRRTGRTDGYLLECRRPDGELRRLQVFGAPLRGADGTVTGSVIVVADETERRQMESELTRLALTDPLTGLPNRATLHDRLGQALARRQRHQTVLAALFVDLDRFKLGQRSTRARRRRPGAARGVRPAGRRAPARRYGRPARRRRVRRALRGAARPGRGRRDR